MMVVIPPVEPTVSEPDPQVWELAALAPPAQEAPLAPPVTERIVMDPSIRETPALPTAVPDRMESPEITEIEPLNESIKPQRLVGPETDPIPPSPAWPVPVALIKTLEPLREDVDTKPWADQVGDLIDRLARLESMADPESGPVLDHLRELSLRVESLAANFEYNKRAALFRVSYALTRRIALWQRIHQLAAHEAPVLDSPSPEALLSLLEQTDTKVQTLTQSSIWREYLLLDSLAAILHSPNGIDAVQFRDLARRLLGRLNDPGLSVKQAELFEQEPFCQLAMELRRWASEPVDYHQLLVDLERYELDFHSRDAEQVARVYQVLRWSTDPNVAKVAEQLNGLYRNGNVRIALSGTLINRLLPPPQQMAEESYDNILDADVYSYSQATTTLKVTLKPDRRQWQMFLEANGQVVSDSESRKGVAAFFNQAFGRFQARKLLVVDRRGVHVGEAEAGASSEASLKGFETDFDGVPLLNMLARSIAKQQYNEKSGQAKREVEGRMAARASNRFDAEVHQRLAQAEKDFQTKILKPLRELDLKPTTVDLETTDKRLIARERLAGNFQLAAHTPRPQAPADSLISLQIHETAMNNALEHLGLEGRRTDLRTLYRELADRFDRTDTPIPEDIPDDVIVQFANDDAVRIRCVEGRITLTIHLAELVHGKSDKWRNFAVRAHYRPTSNQVEANLIRDGVIELAGERLSLRDQVALRGIFSRILSRNRTVSVVNKKLQENPRLAHLIVGQFVIEDGWIGVAMASDGKVSEELDETAQHRASLLRR